MQLAELTSSLLSCLALLMPIGLSYADSSVEDLPKLFNYNDYLRQYNKSYRPASDSHHNKIFIGRSIGIFKHNVLYLKRKSNYYLAPSVMMDLTPSELERVQGKNPDLDLKPVREAEELGDVPANYLKSIQQLSDESDQNGLLASSSEHLENALDNMIEDYMSPDRQVKDTVSMKPDLSAHLDNMIEDYMTPEAADKRVKSKTKVARNIFSRNKDKVRKISDFSEFPAEQEESIEKIMNSFSDSVTNLIDDPSDEVGTSFSDTVKGLLDELDDQYKANVTNIMRPESPPANRIKYKIDWRVTGCISEPKSQRQCNACYIFATLDLMEYFYCRQTKRRANFSVQHILDCGREQGVINGCRGGRMSEVGRFVRGQGLKLETEYPYMGKDDQCKVPTRLSNNVKSEILSWQLFDSITAWYTWARKSPILVGINMPADFHIYGGGIHDGQNCNIQETHAMLLVGSGMQDGIEFWLLKNSFSKDWGEKGYFRLSKSALLNCFGSAIVARASFNQ